MRSINLALALLLVLCLASNAVCASAGIPLDNRLNLSENIRKIDLSSGQTSSEQTYTAGSAISSIPAQKPSDETMKAIGDAARCSAFLKDYADFLVSTPSGKVSFMTISNRPDGLATYASGWLSYNGYDETLTGEGTQYLNRYTDEPQVAPSMYPFDPKSRMQLSLTIDVNSGQATLVSQKMPNVSPSIPQDTSEEGSTVETIALQYDNGLLYGFTESLPSAMFVISLGKMQG